MVSSMLHPIKSQAPVQSGRWW